VADWRLSYELSVVLHGARWRVCVVIKISVPKFKVDWLDASGVFIVIVLICVGKYDGRKKIKTELLNIIFVIGWATNLEKQPVYTNYNEFSNVMIIKESQIQVNVYLCTYALISSAVVIHGLELIQIIHR
jgi:hypothetical protein